MAPQDPRTPRPVSDPTVSGECPSRCSERPEYNVGEEDVEPTEGEGVDFLPELLDLVGWGQVDDEETEKDLP